MLESINIWSILLIITTTIEWLVLRFILGYLSNLKKSKKILNLCLTGTIFIAFYMTSHGFTPNLKVVILISITFALYKFNYEATIWKGIAVSVIFWLMITGIDLIGTSLVVILNSINNMNLLLENNVYRLELIIFTKSTLLLIVAILKSTKLSFEFSKKGYIYLSIPIFTNLTIIEVLLYVLFYEQIPINNNLRLLLLIIFSIMLITNISIIYIIYNIIKINELRHENKSMKEKIEFQHKYYAGLEKAAQLGIDTLYDTHNNILDIILTEKKTSCDNNNIELIVDIDFSICNFIKTSDICNIFSNMIEHSINSCNKVKYKNIDKKVKISGKVINNFFVIKCVNTIDQLKLVNNSNTDEIDLYENIEINSIKHSLEKYSGEVVITSEKDLIKTILIPLVKNCTNFKPKTNS